MIRFFRRFDVESVGVGMFVFFILLALASAAGWVLNIVKLIALINVDGPIQVTGTLIMRLIGLFPWFGAIIGWF